MSKQNAFTLIELMIAVAIVAVLAATATAGYDRYLKIARASEAKLLLSTMIDAQMSQVHKPRLASDGMTELDSCFVRLDPQPNYFDYFADLYDFPVAMNHPPSSSPIDSDWDVLGWPTQGNVFYSYQATFVIAFGGSNNTPTCATHDGPRFFGANFQIIAQGDLDGDKISSSYSVAISSPTKGDFLKSNLFVMNEYE